MQGRESLPPQRKSSVPLRTDGGLAGRVAGGRGRLRGVQPGFRAGHHGGGVRGHRASGSVGGRPGTGRRSKVDEVVRRDGGTAVEHRRGPGCATAHLRCSTERRPGGDERVGQGTDPLGRPRQCAARRGLDRHLPPDGGAENDAAPSTSRGGTARQDRRVRPCEPSAGGARRDGSLVAGRGRRAGRALKPSSLERRRWDFPSNSVGVQLYGRRVSQHRRVDPVLDVPAGTRVRPRGGIGERFALTEEHWLIPAPASNPGMLDMFRRPVDLKSPNGPQASVARRRRSFGEAFGSADALASGFVMWAPTYCGAEYAKPAPSGAAWGLRVHAPPVRSSKAVQVTPGTRSSGGGTDRPWTAPGRTILQRAARSRGSILRAGVADLLTFSWVIFGRGVRVRVRVRDRGTGRQGWRRIRPREVSLRRYAAGCVG